MEASTQQGWASAMMAAMAASYADIWTHRLMAQRLAGPPAASPEHAVGELLAVQAQEAPLARLAIAQRCSGRPPRQTDVPSTSRPLDAVVSAIDAGRIVRTHVLRPTWHYVLRDDLPWLLELTAARIASGLASRHRNLGLADPSVRSTLLDAVTTLLSDGPVTRPVIQEHLLSRGLLERDPLVGQRMAHVLLLAELEGLVASGPHARGEHTYAPWDRPAPRRDRDEAIAELTRRFFVHHGPASVADLMRWVRLNKSEIARAIAALGDALECVDVDGVRLYLGADVVSTSSTSTVVSTSSTSGDSTSPVVSTSSTSGVVSTGSTSGGSTSTFLLSTFDEAFLSYRDVPWARADGHPLADAPYRWSEAGGGPVIHDLQDAGSWRRTVKPGRLIVRLDLATSLDGRARASIEEEARRTAALIDPDAEVALEHGNVPWGVRSPRAGRDD